MANPQLEMRRKNKEFLSKVRQNKPTVNDVSEQRFGGSMGKWVIGLLVFVVCGSAVFELIRLIFLR